MKPKSISKVIKNQCQNKYQTIWWKLWNTMFFWCVKTCKIIVKTMVFEGVAVCVRERKRYQTNIKVETQIHLKINTKPMWKQCSKKWCHHDGKLIENSFQQIAKSRKTCYKYIPKAILKYEIKKWTHVGATVEKWGVAPFNTNNANAGSKHADSKLTQF